MNNVLTFIGTAAYIVLLSACSQPSPDDFAERFCSCSEHLQIDEMPPQQLKQNEEGFLYPKPLEDCFGAAFLERSNDLEPAEREVFLENFKKATLKRCPQHLNHLFE